MCCLARPTSFAPLIHTAIDIVRQSGNRFHILLIIADGQVTWDIGLNGGRLSQQEKETIDAIVAARYDIKKHNNYPLSIVMVGVGDGPWHTIDDAIPTHKFDNFQYVNYTKICAEYRDPLERETAIAAEALMEIPNQYSFIKQMRAVSYPNFKCNPSFLGISNWCSVVPSAGCGFHLATAGCRELSAKLAVLIVVTFSHMNCYLYDIIWVAAKEGLYIHPVLHVVVPFLMIMYLG
ncbi:hypothetical protein GOP47_0024499 [Adiantum capillus-veneris]|uniref:Copine C-terminal domain-containing protein n=1 Tax=Adiantum capillus-veneris TaxID=13818 RepID=A0A9D4U1Z6_ADICA|nr:hypothetical protein GOP47_0024499 [Adiantum capillus-veneris]